MANFMTTTTTSATNLFPFASLNPTSYTNNYQLWVGKCQQEQPPAGINPATVTPGSNQSGVQVQEAPLYMVFKNNGSTVTPADVKVTFTNSGATCSETWGPLTKVTNGPTGSKVVGSSNTYVYGAPYTASGQLTVCADLKSGTTRYHDTVTPTDSFTPPTLP